MRDTQTAVRLLVTLLGRTDARFVPIRGHEWSKPLGGLCAAQQEFRDLGLVPVGGGDARRRKQHQRLIDELVERGALLATTRGKVRYVKLSDSAEDRIRRLCGLPGLWFAYETLRSEFAPDRPTRTEWYFASGHGWGDGKKELLLEVEYRLAPSLSRGLAAAQSAITGHVVYELTVPYDRIPTWSDGEARDDLTSYDDRLLTVYHEALKDERRRLLTSDAAVEIGFIPIPLSTVSAVRQRDAADLVAAQQPVEDTQ